MNDQYKKQVALLIRIMPSVYAIEDFAVHGGTAINLFHKDMPRYSVDIDLTYIPIKGRGESLGAINEHLIELKQKIEKAIPDIKVIHKPEVLKLICFQKGAQVKIEVSGIKRGILGDTEDRELCQKAQEEFHMSCTARVVSYPQLYGGKLTAALSRQHPRDLFDVKYMEEDIESIKQGFMLCLLGSDKPIIESLDPNPVDQTQALQHQFEGMTATSFTYKNYEEARQDLITKVSESLTNTDKEFILSFEEGEPDWKKCCASDLSAYPSVKWKLQNIEKLKKGNPEKYKEGIEKLKQFLFPEAASE